MKYTLEITDIRSLETVLGKLTRVDLYDIERAIELCLSQNHIKFTKVTVQEQKDT